MAFPEWKTSLTLNQTTSSLRKEDDGCETRSEDSGVKRKRRAAFESAIKKIKVITGCRNSSKRDVQLDTGSGASTSQIHDYVEEGPISKLNADCLAHIFSFFNKKELLALEGVCTKWRDLSMRCWLREKSLVTKKEIPGRVSIDQLKQVLKRCGKHITSLDISGMIYPMDSPTRFQLIGEFCKNLRHLNIGGHAVTKMFRMKFIKAAINLESLDVSGCSGLKDTKLAPLLIAAKNLQKCVLRETYIEGPSLVNLSKSCKYLDLSQCISLRSDSLGKALVELPNLEVLKLDRSRIKLLPQDLKACSQNLKELYMSGDRLQLDDKASWPMFPSLQILNLNSNGGMCDQMITLIVEHCPNLEVLDISGTSNEPSSWSYIVSSSVTDTGVKKLIRLNKLKILKMNYHSKITDEALTCLAVNLSTQLNVVECRRCTLLTDVGPNRLIDLCTNLVKLDLTDCTKITVELMNAAATSVQLRINKSTLDLHVSDLSDEEVVVDGRLLLKVHSQETKVFISEAEDTDYSEDDDYPYYFFRKCDCKYCRVSVNSDSEYSG